MENIRYLIELMCTLAPIIIKRENRDPQNTRISLKKTSKIYEKAIKFEK